MEGLKFSAGGASCVPHGATEVALAFTGSGTVQVVHFTLLTPHAFTSGIPKCAFPQHQLKCNEQLLFQEFHPTRIVARYENVNYFMLRENSNTK